MHILKGLALITLSLISTIVYSQQIRLNTYAGYVFKDKVDSYYSNSSYFEATIQDGFRWGAGLEYHIPQKGAIELQYLRQNTNAPAVYSDGIFGGILQQTDFNVKINWVMLNFTRYFPVNERLEPFFGGGLGMGIFNVENPDSGRSDSATKFAWQFRAGSNFWVNDRIGIRIQASLYSAVQSVGGGLYFGTGGVGAGLTSYSSLYQFGFDGGLVFRFDR